MDTTQHTVQFQLGAFALKETLSGITHDESLKAPDEGGNNLNWVLGHILAARNQTLEVLGEEQFWSPDKIKLYSRGSDGAGEAALPWEELQKDLQSSQVRLMECLPSKTAQDLSQPLPKPNEFLGDTVGSALTALCFHEAYHIGQTGLLRRVLGKPGAF